jgi:hypothetical protein
MIDLFPKHRKFQAMADLMVRYNLARQADITGLVDDRFALAASIDGIDDLNSILLPWHAFQLSIPLKIHAAWNGGLTSCQKTMCAPRQEEGLSNTASNG